MPDEPPVIDDDPALDGAAQAAIDREVRVEMAFPVVPQPPRVVLERRTRICALSSSSCVAVESNRVG
jgi:hypothetical protein